MNTLISLFGLDTKARGFLVGYRTYVVCGIAVLVNLGPALIDFGNIINILAKMIESVLNFSDGKPVESLDAQLKAIVPYFTHIDICLAAMAAAYAKAGLTKHISDMTEKVKGEPKQ